MHQASHQLLSKDRGYNKILGHLAAIFGGLSYSEFTQSHGLHHKFQGQKIKDPDYGVTHSSNLWFLPFQIWRKDVYFFQNGLHLKSKAWLGYLVDRGLQIGLVLYFFIWPGLAFYFAYWLLAVLVVGFLNGLFLFYFPHYSTKWEIKTRSLARIWLLPSISLAFIDICRYYHEWHHNQIKSNQYYFPLENYLYQKLIGQNQNLQWTGKYLHKI